MFTRQDGSGQADDRKSMAMLFDGWDFTPLAPATQVDPAAKTVALPSSESAPLAVSRNIGFDPNRP